MGPPFTDEELEEMDKRYGERVVELERNWTDARVECDRLRQRCAELETALRLQMSLHGKCECVHCEAARRALREKGRDGNESK